MSSNVSLFHRHEAAQWKLALATLPKSGVVEYDATPVCDRIPAAQLTGPARRLAIREALENLR